MVEFGMLDIVLVNPVLSYADGYENKHDDVEEHHPPLGFLYLAAVLREKGFKVGVIDPLQKLGLKEIVEEIRRKKPKIVGLSAVTASMRGAYQLARAIKKIRPETVTVLGGHHVSCDPGVVERFRCFDYGITGEGEITLVKLAEKIIKEKEPPKKKLWMGKLPLDLDKIPFPARDLVDFGRLKPGAMMSILSSRGCPYQCIFCSRPAISKRVRYRSPKLVVEEMVELQEKYGEREIVFQDDTFNMNREHVQGICREITKSGYRFRWTAYARFNLVDEESLKLMAKAGCRKLMFGVESGNPRVRNEIVKKEVGERQIERGIKWCWKYGIEPDVFLMLGFPTETKDELEDTVNFGRKYEPNILGAHITCIYPGSRLWEMAVKEGRVDPKMIDDYILGKMGEDFNKIWPKYVPRGMTTEDLKRAGERAHRRFYLSGRYVWKKFWRDIGSWKRLREDMRQAYSVLRYGRSYAKK